MHGSSHRLLTQLCSVAFRERSLRPEGAHLITVNHGDTLLTVQRRSNSSGVESIVLFEDGTMLEWQTETAVVRFYNACRMQPSEE